MVGRLGKGIGGGSGGRKSIGPAKRIKRRVVVEFARGFAQRQSVYEASGVLGNKRLRALTYFVERDGLGDRFSRLVRDKRIVAKLAKLVLLRGATTPFMDCLREPLGNYGIGNALLTAGSKNVYEALICGGGKNFAEAMVMSTRSVTDLDGGIAFGSFLRTSGGKNVGWLLHISGGNNVGAVLNVAGCRNFNNLLHAAPLGFIEAALREADGVKVGNALEIAGGKAFGKALIEAGGIKVGKALNMADGPAGHKVGLALRDNFRKAVERIKAGEHV